MDKKESELMAPLINILNLIQDDIKGITNEEKLLIKIRTYAQVAVQNLNNLYLKAKSVDKENTEYALKNDELKKIIKEININKSNAKYLNHKILNYDNLYEDYHVLSDSFVKLQNEYVHLKQHCPKVGQSVYVKYKVTCQDIGNLQHTKYRIVRGTVIEYIPAKVKLNICRNKTQCEVLHCFETDIYTEESMKKFMKGVKCKKPSYHLATQKN